MRPYNWVIISNLNNKLSTKNRFPKRALGKIRSRTGQCGMRSKESLTIAGAAKRNLYPGKISVHKKGGSAAAKGFSSSRQHDKNHKFLSSD